MLKLMILFFFFVRGRGVGKEERFAGNNLEHLRRQCSFSTYLWTSEDAQWKGETHKRHISHAFASLLLVQTLWFEAKSDWNWYSKVGIYGVMVARLEAKWHHAGVFFLLEIWVQEATWSRRGKDQLYKIASLTGGKTLWSARLSCVYMSVNVTRKSSPHSLSVSYQWCWFVKSFSCS